MRGSNFLALAVGGLALGALEGGGVALVVRLPPAARGAPEAPSPQKDKADEGGFEDHQPVYCPGEDDALDGQAYDYIVVGAGTAGSTAAGRLAEAGKSVLLLERGPDDDWKGVDSFGVIHPETPKAWMRMIGHKDIDPGPGPTQQAVTRAEMVGGCSMTNLMVWMRGAKEVWDMWGDDQWAYDCVLAKFKEMEDSSALPGLDPKYHGTSGPVKLSHFKNYMNTNDFYTWAGSRGFDRNEDFNGPSQVGYGPYQVNAFEWTRWSMSRAFLTPTVRALPDFKLLTLATVTKILFNGTAAVGVQYERTVKREAFGECRLRGTASAGKEIIISGGAYRSPQLLILSGVGPAETLEKFHIPVVKALEGVGRNLQDHPRLEIFRGNPPAAITRALEDNHTTQVLDVNTTSLSSGAVFVSAWCKKYPSLDACRAGPDLQFVVWDTGVVDGIVGTPLSRGNVTVVSTDPYEQVAVYNNWLTDSQGGDRARIEELWRLGLDMRGLSQQGPLPEFHLVYDDHSAFGLTTLLQNLTLTRLIFEEKVAPVTSMWHPAGTCKMGPAADEHAVVDYDLRVHGLQNLRIADASVMPHITNTNTNAPSAMIGWTVADLILGRKCARLSRAA